MPNGFGGEVKRPLTQRLLRELKAFVPCDSEGSQSKGTTSVMRETTAKSPYSGIVTSVTAASNAPSTNFVAGGDVPTGCFIHELGPVNIGR